MYKPNAIILNAALLISGGFLIDSHAEQYQAFRGGKTLFDRAGGDGQIQVKDAGRRDLAGFFLESILDIFDKNNENEENDKNEVKDSQLLDVTNDSSSGELNVTDSFQNFTEFIEGLTDTVQNITDAIFGDLNLTDGQFNTSDNGIFGDLNLTDGGLFGSLNLTDGGLFGDFNLTDGIFNNSDGLFGGLNFTGSLFNDIFNNTGGIFADLNLTGGLFGELFNEAKTLSVLTPATVEQWLDDVVFDDETVCKNDDAAPECFDQFGKEGFWSCRTLTNPFTGKPSSASVCVSKGQFLTDNDECGCCIPEGSDEPSCPAVCECICDLKEVGDGVLITTATIFGNTTVCVDPRLAASVVSSSLRVACSDACTQN
jgi:hypothetical protein